MSQYSQVIYKDLMLEMRDGVHLATDVYRPAEDGEPLSEPVPTILCRTPYDKNSRRYVEVADYFVPHGYAVALQDLRGRGDSEGTGQYHHVCNEPEGRDGYDTIEWIGLQPWSNGKVGMVGSSFAALVQTRAAFEKPPHLAAIWPDVTPTNSYHHQAREGGAMALHMFWALYLHAQDAQEIDGDEKIIEAVWNDLRNLRELLLSMPFQRGQTALAHVPNLENILFDYYHRGEYDKFWQQEFNDFERNFHRHADIPATFTDGWFDPYAVGMAAYFTAMARQNDSPQRLVIGPWTHVGMRGEGTSIGDVDFGQGCIWGIDHYFDQQLLFFDRWLKAEDQGTDDTEPPVQIFVMGGGSGRKTKAGKLDHGGCWRQENEWPLARTEWRTLHLHTDGCLADAVPAEDSKPLNYSYDPEHPVPTIGGNSCGMMELPEDTGDLDPMWKRYLHPVTRLRHIVTPGPRHQKEEADVFGARPPFPLLADRPDVLVFQSDPLEAAVEVTGSARVELWISSSAPDTDFTAKLVDVYPPNQDYPDGYHMNLVDSILRVRYRNSWEKEELMEPGEVYQIKIALPPTSNLFQAGHRIRLDISSSNFPRLDLNPNTGEPMGRHTRTEIARNTVYVDRGKPSNLTLPVISA
jgi:putative CocE/NonD family hydrolase